MPDAMSTQRSHHEPFAWWLTRERIGQDLRERYPALQELPPRLLALVRKLDAPQGNQSPVITTDALRLNQQVRRDGG